MTSNTHKKHAHVAKPLGGKFHATEIGIIGAPCGIIQKLTAEVAERLPKFRLGYVDAEHGNDGPAPTFFRNYTDKIGHHQVNFHSDHWEYEARQQFADTDAVLVNGNHFKSDKQIVIINAKKKESLQRKLDRLTKVLAFVLDDDMEEIHDYLPEHNPQFGAMHVLKISEVDRIASLIATEIRKNIPPVYGLVLAGGKSMRMGYDKSAIAYHGKPQREHMAEVLDGLCDATFISAREPGLDSNFPVLPDSFTDLGPFGGILSAFRFNPNAAWLTVATDVPLLDKNGLNLLLEKRNPAKVATCFHNPETNFPEPLITLWEPKAYPRLLNFLTLGYSCPRKVLINSDIEELKIDRTEILLNANTPEEREKLEGMIHG